MPHDGGDHMLCQLCFLQYCLFAHSSILDLKDALKQHFFIFPQVSIILALSLHFSATLFPYPKVYKQISEIVFISLRISLSWHHQCCLTVSNYLSWNFNWSICNFLSQQGLFLSSAIWQRGKITHLWRWPLRKAKQFFPGMVVSGGEPVVCGTVCMEVCVAVLSRF